MKSNLFILLMLVLSCSSPASKESTMILEYVKELSSKDITNGDIILINSIGCNGCIEKGLAYLEQNNLYDRYKVLIISKKALDEYDSMVNKSKFIIDSQDLLEKLNISQSGFVIVSFKQAVVVNMYSLNPETDLNSLRNNSISNLSVLHATSCANCMIK